MRTLRFGLHVYVNRTSTPQYSFSSFQVHRTRWCREKNTWTDELWEQEAPPHIVAVVAARPAGGAVEPHQPVSELTAPRRPRCRCKRPPPEQKKHERVDMKAARHSVFDRDSPTQGRVFVVVAVFFLTYVSSVTLYPGRVIFLQKSGSVAVHSRHGQRVNVGETSCDLARKRNTVSQWGAVI